ncbi:c-type cytochrome [Amaricoccus solimangrovi]|uniref:Cytochrome c n=1 Tax=Amaricoccus solimangrovi TaxID=2589815 RepID=A0A501WWL7_9RHOB|nr:cytochrome c [Amaricoccus solimangrovi]TPE52645.1 cytochrome c [Amaricoccus solimangrovi]
MRTVILAIGLTTTLGAPAFAEGVVDARAAQMSANGAAAAVSGGMLKGEIPYSPAVGKAAIAAFDATALSFGLMFPDGATSKEASPKIWEDRAGFDAELAKFQEATAAAVKAAGKAGPADLDAFKAAVQPVLGTCKSCHEHYRLDN